MREIILQTNNLTKKYGTQTAVKKFSMQFGVCFKPAKLPCRQQMNHCIDCANFCTCKDNIPEYEAEIERVRKLLELGKSLDRKEWVEKNRNYLEILEKMLERIRTKGLVHKNGHIREEQDGR